MNAPHRRNVAARSVFLLFARMFVGMLALTATLACAPRRQSTVVTPGSRPAFAELTRAIESTAFRRIEAVLVEQHGDVLYEAYFGTTTAESRIDARSASKSITALAVGIAIDRGKLSGVDAALLDFFPDRMPIAHDGAIKREIRLHDVLSMSSALACNDWQPSPGNEERMYRRDDWTRFALDIPLDPHYSRNGEGQGRFSYCTAGAFLLGRVVERATGEPFDAFVQRELFDPLRIVEPRWRRSPTGEVQSGGQLSLRARDFAAIGRLVLNRGTHHGQSIISYEWLRTMLAPRVRATGRDAYGYLWWIRDFHVAERPHPGFYMSGNGGNKVIVFPELDAVVVVLSTNYNDRDMHDLSTAIVERYVLPGLTVAAATVPS